uniref:Putative site-specific DNA recombinase n=1 Tax=viral metagenome TaxID=1070528 RepID=A0A6H1ZD66_9ZZZZ
MYAAGATVGRIHRELHLYGAINSYRTFWPNRLYVGVLQFGDLTIPDYCDPIISQPIWDACQERLKHYAGHHHVQSGSKDHPRRANSPFILSGLARCARCGSPLYGHSSKQRSGSVLQSYFCTRAYRNRDCLKRRIPRLTFENAVLDTLTGYILRPDTLQAARQLIIDEQAGALEEYRRQAKALSGQLSKLRRQIKNVTAAIAESGHSQALLARLADLETQETALLQRRVELETAAVAPLPPLDLAQLPAALAALRQSSDPQTLRAILGAFIDHVTVQRDGNTLTGVIYYYLPPDLKKAIPPPESGGSTVPISLCPSGPPLYRHSLPYSFTTPCHKKTGS